MTEDTVSVPEHYKVLAAELKGLVLMIDEAFINRPVPEGMPWKDIKSALLPVINKTGDSIKSLTKIINSLPGCMANQKAGPVAVEKIRAAVSELEYELRNIIVWFHKIWETPFPLEFAAGQPLVSAVTEDVLRGCRMLFLKVIDLAEMSPEKITEKYGSTKITLSATFGDQPALRLNGWLNTTTAERKSKLNAVRRRAD